jgi:chromosome segregation protein
MKFKKLEIQGFKTFADKTVLDFNPDSSITCIVGPNGCGKSNLLDAIRWVMGEQSVKLLRGLAQEEVIFAGSTGRKPTSLAEAELLIDNRERKINLDYDEVAIKRRLFRSGESEYYINKELVRLKDIQNLLMDTGLGKGSYAIIGQGQVEQILVAKPEDRRSIFEEAAGINKYRSRKLVSLRKLEKTDLNLVRLLDLRSEITSQLGPLESQAQKAQEYQLLKKELGTLEIGLYRNQIDKIMTEKAALEAAVAAQTEKVTSARTSANNFEVEKNKLRELLKACEKNIEALRHELTEKSRKIEIANSEIKISSERKQTHHERLLQMDEEMAASGYQIETIQTAIKQLEVEKLQITQDLAQVETELSHKDAETQKYIQDWQNLSESLDRARRDAVQSEEKISKQKHELIDLQSQEKYNRADLAAASERLQKLEQDLAEMAGQATKVSEKMHQGETRLSELKGQREVLFVERKAKDELKTKLMQSRQEIKERLDTKASRLEVIKEMQRNYEGYDRGVRSILSAKKDRAAEFGAVLGVLADLIQVPGAYETALEQALGQYLQMLVVPQAALAKQCIQYLRERELGRATIFPLDLVPQPGTSKIPGVTRLSEITKVLNPAAQKLVDYLLGRIATVENLEQAYSLREQLKNQSEIRYLITPAGEVLSVLGSVTGGKNINDNAMLLGRNREMADLEKDLEFLKQDFQKVLSEENQNQTRLEDIEFKLLQLAEEVSVLEIEQGTLANDAARYRIESDKRKQELAKLQEASVKKEVALSSVVASQVQIQQAIEVLTQERQVLLDHQNTIEASYKDSFQNKEKVNQALNDLRLHLANLKGHARQNDIKAQNFKEGLAEQQRLLKARAEEKERLEQRILEAQTQVEQLKLNLPNALSEEQQIQEKMMQVTTQKEAHQNQIERLEKDAREINETDRKLRAELSELEIKLARMESELGQIENRLNTEYEITLTEVLKQKNEEHATLNYEEVKELVEKIRSKMKRLGMVNPLAIDEYAAQKERMEFIESQCADLEKAKQDLLKLIKELDVLAEKAYIETFAEVKKHFEKLFSELFEGGSADLEITDPAKPLESGVDIFAQPTGKKRQNLMLLSGGEKALTAIALLFALMKTNPSPFYVLDEIDAALDEVNTGRFAGMLKNLANQESHFMVITHSKRTMSAADTMYGVTMEHAGISKLISMKLVQDAA